MLVQRVGDVTILPGVRSLARLSRRTDLNPAQRKAVVSAVVQRLETRMKGSHLQLFDPDTLVEALTKAQGFNAFITTNARDYIKEDLPNPPKPGREQRFNMRFADGVEAFLGSLSNDLLCVVSWTDNNWLLSKVIEVPDKGLDQLPTIALRLNHPATEAFKKLDKANALYPELLNILSKSKNMDVVQAVAQHHLTTADTLMDIVLQLNMDGINLTVDSPTLSKPVKAALKSLFSRDDIALSSGQVARLLASPNTLIGTIVATLTGDNIEALTDMASKPNSYAVCAYKRLRDKGLLVGDEIIKLMQSEDKEMLIKMASDPSTSFKNGARICSNLFRKYDEGLNIYRTVEKPDDEGIHGMQVDFADRLLKSLTQQIPEGSAKLTQIILAMQEVDPFLHDMMCGASGRE